MAVTTGEHSQRAKVPEGLQSLSRNLAEVVVLQCAVGVRL